MASKSLPVLVVGSLNMDLSCYTQKIPRPGETLMGDRFETVRNIQYIFTNICYHKFKFYLKGLVRLKALEQSSRFFPSKFPQERRADFGELNMM